MTRRDLREIAKQRAKDLRDKDRAKLRELRDAIRRIRSTRRAAVQGARAGCKMRRNELREEAKSLRAKAMGEIRQAVELMRQSARSTCQAAVSEARSSGMAAEDTKRAELRATRALIREIRHADGLERTRLRSTSSERRRESDDEVRSNILPEHLALFEKVRRQIKGTDRKSRTEVFLQYVEENPGELIETMSELSDAEVRRMVREEKRLAKAVRSPSHYRKLASGDLSDVPF